MEPQKPGNSPGPGPETRQCVRSRVRSWTVLNEMRVSAGAAGRILDSPNRREIRTEGCVRCSGDEKEPSERDYRAQVLRW